MEMHFLRIRVIRLRGVLRPNGRELSLGEARESTAPIVLLFECSGERENDLVGLAIPKLKRRCGSGFVRRSKR